MVSFFRKFQWKFAVWSSHTSCLLLCTPVKHCRSRHDKIKTKQIITLLIKNKFDEKPDADIWISCNANRVLIKWAHHAWSLFWKKSDDIQCLHLSAKRLMYTQFFVYISSNFSFQNSIWCSFFLKLKFLSNSLTFIHFTLFGISTDQQNSRKICNVKKQ